MGTTRTIAAASLAALLLVTGCGDDDSPSTPTTAAGSSTVATTATTVPATTTTRSPDALRAALLQATDLPGATQSPATEGDSDLSACFPGNPLGAKTDPLEVDSPEFELTDGAVERNYSSSARTATPEQAKDFVTTFGSSTGSACVLNAFKAYLAAPPDPVDASGLAGKPTTAAVGDGGSLLTITGTLQARGDSQTLGLELLVFQKGPVVVLLSSGAFGGVPVPGQTLQLAQKIAGRLS